MPPAGSSRGKVAHGSILSDSFGGRRVNSKWQSTRNGVTFVSVTQSFNTTTSMGRLTLNILLSFAQFEREVTAERIRDKVKA